ncbi:ANR family transcriptional regulator, partial [Escherichia coli]|nr:ANR family transcriptional regulator [Escherichia coli]
MHQDIKEYRAGNRCAAYSLGASRAEQRGDYAEAEKLWRKAAQSPCSTLRRIWA